MNGRTDAKVIIEKWRLDSLVEEMELVLKSVGKIVGATSVAADYPDSAEEHDFAIKEAARCYNMMMYLIEGTKRDLETAKEVPV